MRPARFHTGDDVPETPRVRFAPSPTGHLHIGGARTAIYNWAFARHMGGVFVLRIDDTDPERSTVENTDAILRALRWLGLDWDEGPDTGGPFAPYFQTERAETYREALDALRASGDAYPCFCGPADLEMRREAARIGAASPGYDRSCRALSPQAANDRVTAGEPHAWRLAVPEDRGDVTFTDLVRGEMSFPSESLDDFVLVRGDGTPTYNFASIVDDSLMDITHVIRGDDHLSNTPRQILVLEALGRPVPCFAHLSMILGADGTRLSKRHGATSVEAYRDEGHLPEAVVNYLALLGWSPGDDSDAFSSSILVERFELGRVSRNPAIFDPVKLEWLNGVHIRELTAAEFVDRATPWLVDAGLLGVGDVAARRDWLEELAPMLAERVRRMDEIVPMVRFLFVTDVEIDPDARAKVALDSDATLAVLQAARQALASVPVFDAGSVETALRDVPTAVEAKPKVVFQALRVAITGSTVSLPLFESIALLGRDATLARIDAVLP
jgi:glutamyl-tRNA synthetase